jgi:hypothetical protein
MSTDPNKEFLKGLQVIEDAIDAECRARGIGDPMGRHDGKGSPHSVVFSLQANGRKVEQRFTSEEVRDSARGLNSSVRLLVRALVTVPRGTQDR